MQLGISTWVWAAPLTTTDLATLAPRIANMGFDLVEIPIEGLQDVDYEQAARIIKDNGLGVTVAAAMGPDRDLITPDTRLRENGLAYLRRCIEATQIMGGTNLVGPMYSSTGRVWQATPSERERDVQLLVSQLKSLAAYAGDHGVVLCLEPLNRFETSFINTASQAIEVIDRVGHPACKILLDTFHMNIEERSIGDAIRAMGSRLGQLHVCENDRGAPGSGHISWTDVAKALRDINYDGPVVIESFTSGVKTIARAASIWRPLAASQDALAQDGLAFLRSLLA